MVIRFTLNRSASEHVQQLNDKLADESREIRCKKQGEMGKGQVAPTQIHSSPHESFWIIDVLKLTKINIFC
jgi:hypothetical protein